MTELEVITTAVGSLAALSAVIGAAAASRGWVEGSFTLKIVPLSKRRAPELKAEPAAEPAGDAVPLREAS